VFELFVTVAVNCCVLGVPVDRGTNAYVGAIATLTGPCGASMVMLALALFDGSTWLVAISVTGSIAGTVAGAK